MVANQKKYTDEFRRETADYVISTGRPITQVCEELGLNSKTVNDWVLKRRRELGGEPDPRAEDHELREAKKRMRELELAVTRVGLVGVLLLVGDHGPSFRIAACQSSCAHAGSARRLEPACPK